MIGKFPKYITDDQGYVYDVVGGEIEMSVYSNAKYMFECTRIDKKPDVKEKENGMNSIHDILMKTYRGIEIVDQRANPFEIEKVIYNDPATIVFWADGTKTVVKCGEEDVYDYQTGLLMCIAKKVYGNKGKFNDILREWMPEEEEVEEEKNPFEVMADLLNAALAMEVKTDA